MFRSCVLRSRAFLNRFLFGVHSQSRNVTYLSGYRHISLVGQNLLQEQLWNLNSVASTFSYTYCTDTRVTSKTSDTSVQKSSVTSSRNRKSDTGPVITLIGIDNNPTVLSLSEAEKIAKRRDLKLVKIADLETKTQRPVYQLMTGTQYYKEDRKLQQDAAAKKKSGFKGEKLLTLSHRITPHDLSSKLKNISKWLSKTYGVRIVISGDSENMKSAEEVYDTIAESMKMEGRVVQKQQKGSDIRFQILPPKKETKNPEESDAVQEKTSSI